MFSGPDPLLSLRLSDLTPGPSKGIRPKAGSASTSVAASTPGTEPTGQHRLNDPRMPSRPEPKGTDRSARSGCEIALRRPKPGHTTAFAPGIPPPNLKLDDRGGTVHPNRARSGVSGGGTMRLNFLSAGRVFRMIRIVPKEKRGLLRRTAFHTIFGYSGQHLECRSIG